MFVIPDKGWQFNLFKNVAATSISGVRREDKLPASHVLHEFHVNIRVFQRAKFYDKEYIVTYIVQKDAICSMDDALGILHSVRVW
ncbi:hypothetical protein B188_03360 [Candidatus Brocadiaceae bacterium B188]|nr:hypothetical protein B188_03360 [Candidatus Brocadiaceae bacterium B188]